MQRVSDPSYAKGAGARGQTQQSEPICATSCVCAFGAYSLTQLRMKRKQQQEVVRRVAVSAPSQQDIMICLRSCIQALCT